MSTASHDRTDDAAHSAPHRSHEDLDPSRQAQGRPPPSPPAPMSATAAAAADVAKHPPMSMTRSDESLFHDTQPLPAAADDDVNDDDDDDDDDEEAQQPYHDPAPTPHPPPPPPDFKPFMLLIEDPQTGEHQHPAAVHYIFADDDDDDDNDNGAGSLIPAAAFAALEAGDPASGVQRVALAGIPLEVLLELADFEIQTGQAVVAVDGGGSSSVRTAGTGVAGVAAVAGAFDEGVELVDAARVPAGLLVELGRGRKQGEAAGGGGRSGEAGEGRTELVDLRVAAVGGVGGHVVLVEVVEAVLLAVGAREARDHVAVDDDVVGRVAVRLVLRAREIVGVEGLGCETAREVSVETGQNLSQRGFASRVVGLLDLHFRFVDRRDELVRVAHLRARLPASDLLRTVGRRRRVLGQHAAEGVLKVACDATVGDGEDDLPDALPPLRVRSALSGTTSDDLAPDLGDLLDRVPIRTTSPRAQDQSLRALGLRDPQDRLHLARDQLPIPIAIADAAGAPAVHAFVHPTAHVGKPEHSRADDIDEKSIPFLQIVRLGGAVPEDHDVGGVDAAQLGQAVEVVPQRSVEGRPGTDEFLLAVRPLEEATTGLQGGGEVENGGVGVLSSRLDGRHGPLAHGGAFGDAGRGLQRVAALHADAWRRGRGEVAGRDVGGRIVDEVGSMDAMAGARARTQEIRNGLVDGVLGSSRALRTTHRVGRGDDGGVLSAHVVCEMGRGMGWRLEVHTCDAGERRGRGEGRRWSAEGGKHVTDSGTRIWMSSDCSWLGCWHERRHVKAHARRQFGGEPIGRSAQVGGQRSRPMTRLELLPCRWWCTSAMKRADEKVERKCRRSRVQMDGRTAGKRSWSWRWRWS
nr:hypothetical protein CFP56_03118 [Quercus suber]